MDEPKAGVAAFAMTTGLAIPFCKLAPKLLGLLTAAAAAGFAVGLLVAGLSVGLGLVELENMAEGQGRCLGKADIDMLKVHSFRGV